MYVRPSDFESIFEIGVAIHVAYTLLDDVRRATLKRFHDSAMYIKEYRDLFEQAKSRDLITKIMLFEQEWIRAMNELRFPIHRFLAISVLSAVFSVGCLVFIGFRPSAEWRLSLLVPALMFALLPMPLFLILTRLRARGHVNSLNKLVTDVQDEIGKLLGLGAFKLPPPPP